MDLRVAKIDGRLVMDIEDFFYGLVDKYKELPADAVVGVNDFFSQLRAFLDDIEGIVRETPILEYAAEQPVPGEAMPEHSNQQEVSKENAKDFPRENFSYYFKD